MNIKEPDVAKDKGVFWALVSKIVIYILVQL